MKGTLLFRGKFLSMKRILIQFQQLNQPGRYQMIDNDHSDQPITVEYEPDDDELEMIRKIRYKLKFEED